MVRTFIINKYLAKEFSKVVINVLLIFFCLGFIMNLFEEINFFKDINIGIYLPVLLSIIFIPSMMYNMLPFIILLSGIWFFLKIKRSDEVTAMKVSGMSNFSIIIVPCVLSIILGVFFITTINITFTNHNYYCCLARFSYRCSIPRRGILFFDRNNDMLQQA